MRARHRNALWAVTAFEIHTADSLTLADSLLIPGADVSGHLLPEPKRFDAASSSAEISEPRTEVGH
jgi:hypothetical protein